MLHVCNCYDILYNISKYLTIEKIISTLFNTKMFSNILKNDDFWEMIYNRDFYGNHIDKNLSFYLNYKNVYIEGMNSVNYYLKNKYCRDIYNFRNEKNNYKTVYKSIEPLSIRKFVALKIDTIVESVESHVISNNYLCVYNDTFFKDRMLYYILSHGYSYSLYYCSNCYVPDLIDHYNQFLQYYFKNIKENIYRFLV